MFYDAHNHLHCQQFSENLDEIIATCRDQKILRMVVNGTRESDWPRVLELAQKYPIILPSFGLHPWHTNGHTQEWKENLLSHLDACPSAVGEIGLDRWMKDPDLERQEEIFRWQLSIAAERNLPVSIHCLKCWGKLDEILRDADLPQRGFLLHSYGGPAEMVDGFVKLGACFSISGYFAHERKSKSREAFKLVPMDRLLVETDAPDMIPPPDLIGIQASDEDGATVNHPANIVSIYEFAAALRGMSIEEFCVCVARNFQNLFGGVST